MISVSLLSVTLVGMTGGCAASSSGSSGIGGASGSTGGSPGRGGASAGASGRVGTGGTGGTAGSAGMGGTSGGVWCGGTECSPGLVCCTDCSGFQSCAIGCVYIACTTTCGGLIGAQCSAGEWCHYNPTSACGAGDVQGSCLPRPTNCTADCPGVCGCDGQFYCNECTANSFGVDVSGDTSCLDGGAGNGCTSDSQCQPGLKCCYPCGIPDCQNQCIQPLSNGQCPMYP
jgi:hypothetical protein